MLRHLQQHHFVYTNAVAFLVSLRDEEEDDEPRRFALTGEGMEKLRRAKNSASFASRL